MKPFSLIGYILIVLGVLALGRHAFTYRSTEKVLDIGSVHVTAERNKTILPLPPLAGGALLVGGIAFLAVGRNKD